MYTSYKETYIELLSNLSNNFGSLLNEDESASWVDRLAWSL